MSYIFQVKKLQRQLEEEIDLQLALTDAITNNATLILEPSAKLPNKVHVHFSGYFACVSR